MNDDPGENVITEREILINILELYKDFLCLWDLSHKDYSNKDLRNQAYSIMLEVLKKLDSAATLKTLKNKLDNMRTSYKRERKKVESSKSTGAGTSEVHTPALWYYQYLSFLDEKLDSSAEAIDNLNTGNENKDEPAKKKKRDLRETTLLKRQEMLIESAQKALSSTEDSADAFGRSMSSQLKELPKLQRCLAEKLMSEIIFYAKLDLLNVNTAINLNHVQNPRESFNSQHTYAHPPSLSFRAMPSQRHPPPSPNYSIPSPCYPPPSPNDSIPSPRHPTPSPNDSIPSPRHPPPSPNYSIPSPRQPPPLPNYSIPSPRQPPPSPHHSVISFTQSDLSAQEQLIILTNQKQLLHETYYPNASFSAEHDSNIFRGNGETIKDFLIFKKNN